MTPRAQAGLPERQLADVERVEAVHVFVRVDAVGHRGLLDVRRQRQLHEDAIDLGVTVQTVDQFEQRLLGGRLRQIEVAGDDPGPLAVPPLGANVNAGRRIGADEHDGQPRTPAARRNVLLDRFTDAGNDRGTDLLTVKNFCNGRPFRCIHGSPASA